MPTLGDNAGEKKMTSSLSLLKSQDLEAPGTKDGGY